MQMPPGLARLSRPGCDVDRVAEQILAVRVDAALIDANAVWQHLRSCLPCFVQRHLNVAGARDGVFGAGEFGEHAVSASREDPPSPS